MGVFKHVAIVLAVLIAGQITSCESYPDSKEFPNVRVQFVTQQTGWIVGPRLLQTQDGGNTWKILRENGPGTILSEISDFEDKRIQFINPQVGWTLDEGRKALLKTSDGGLTWPDRFPIPVENDESILQSIFFISLEEGWVAGKYIYHTNDGGRHWQRLSQAPSKDEKRDAKTRIAEGYDPHLWFTDPNQGILARKDGDMYQTLDGGRTWTRVLSVDYFLTNLFFSDGQNGWVVGSQGYMARTTNGGKTWEGIKLPVTSQLNSIFMRDQRGAAVGTDGTAIYTEDGGRTWQTGSINGLKGQPRLASVYFSDESRGWAVGGNPYDEFNYSSKPSNIILVTDDKGKTWRPFQPSGASRISSLERNIWSVHKPPTGPAALCSLLPHNS